MHGENGPEDITRMDAKKDLGVWLSSSMSSLHYEKSAQKAFAVLRMIWHIFSRITRKDFQILYRAYARPLLEYANQVVYSGRKKDVTLIERVQRAATKMVTGLKSWTMERVSWFLAVDPANTRRGRIITFFAVFVPGVTGRAIVSIPLEMLRARMSMIKSVQIIIIFTFEHIIV
ncbi:hypothetical protein CLF_111285 [Clonorchis sinensis]|uniref:Uncharacterized protein n=1 Tax=Clonorchis sinensis TaxID=79923 RepID=G7YLK9_CLOSI|nr:hypothetical protein CLF_111285 [Clonorchis sinensis]